MKNIQFKGTFIILALLLLLNHFSFYGLAQDENIIYPLDIPTEKFWFDDMAQNSNYSPSVECKSMLLMEESTGNIIYAANENEKLPIASVTKIMSILLTVEAIKSGKISINDIVTVSEYASSMGGSQIFLESGEKMSVNDLLKSLIVVSANDAAVALAEHIYGSASSFILAMNERAKELGMLNTSFKNTTGLDEEGHYSSALDVALMTKELLKHNMIFDYTTIWIDSIRNGSFGLSNTNRLVRFYDGANGMKTGYTDKAMYCLSGTAKRNGMQLIAVVLGAKTSNDRFAATKSLLDYGFANFSVITPEKLSVEKISVNGGENKYFSADYTPTSILLKKDDKNSVEQKIFIDENIIAPVKKGQVVGKVVYSIRNQKICEIPLISGESIEKVSLKVMINKIWRGILFGIL